MMTRRGPPVADEPEGLWLPIAELARGRGVSKQALAKRVERLERLGHMETRPGPRGAKLVNVAAFDRAAGLTVDAVRQLNGAGVTAEAAPSPANPADPVLAREQARRAAYDADLKRLDLMDRLGLVVPVADVQAAMVEAGAIMVRALDRLPAKLDDMLAASREGQAGGRRFLRDLGVELRMVIATAMQSAADLRKGEPGADLDSVEIPAEP